MIGQFIRWSTAAAVTGVAAVAGWTSYEHAEAIVRNVGERGSVAVVYPLTIDGLIYAASMVILDCSRRKIPAPPLARWLMAGGIAASAAVNLAAGIRHGAEGLIVYGWPAPALVGCYELLMWLIRSHAANQETANLAADSETAARMAYAASRVAGNPFSARALADQYGISRAKASTIVADLASQNGHHA